MAKTFNEKALTGINFAIVFYFLAIYSVYVFEVDHIAIGVVRELFTIPFLVAQLPLLYIGAKRFFDKEKVSSLYVLSISLLALCAILTIGSFLL